MHAEAKIQNNVFTSHTRSGGKALRTQEPLLFADLLRGEGGGAAHQADEKCRAVSAKSGCWLSAKPAVLKSRPGHRSQRPCLSASQTSVCRLCGGGTKAPPRRWSAVAPCDRAGNRPTWRWPGRQWRQPPR